MKVTQVRVFPAKEEHDRVLAFAAITFDHAFVIRDLRIIKGEKGMFIAMPSRRRSDGTFSDVAHPLSPELRVQIERKILGSYRKMMEKQKHHPPSPQTENPGRHF